MAKRTIDSYFKKPRVDICDKDVSQTSANCPSNLHEGSNAIIDPSPPHLHAQNYLQEMKNGHVDESSIVRDPGLRRQIWDYPVNERDKIRRAYIKSGPYQHYLLEYPASGRENHQRRFQASWFQKYPSWLEYSPVKDAAFCLPCFIFNKLSTGRFGSNVFTVDGFCNWKKVGGKDCAFLQHIGSDPCSPHNISEQACKDLMIQVNHVDNVINRQTSEEIKCNRLRLKTSIDCAKWIAFQACAFRGHDESADSKNQGNYIEMIKLLASYNEEVAKVVLDNAPRNAKYTSPTIQKEILDIISTRVQKAIRDEIGNAKYCIIVDESRDEAKREQMAIVIRFVDINGFIRERFLDIVHVKDTSAVTLKKAISDVLSQHNLSIRDMRGQGYDGASNMRGEWKGLQALFTTDCKYAYYVHCFAHRLQLALVAASREVVYIHQFFSKLTFVINIVGSSSKRNDELHDIQASKLAEKIAANEIETGRGINQIGTLQRAGDTRWGSHFHSISSLIRLFDSTCIILSHIVKDGTTYSQRGDVDSAYNSITSFEFIFILHLMKEILGFTDVLCRALQNIDQDILNAIALVSTTRSLIQGMRQDGWNTFFDNVLSFCTKQNIDVPDMCLPYSSRARSRHEKSNITLEHHYRVDIFMATLDTQLQELDHRFNDTAMELLRLSSALDPQDGYKKLNIDEICFLAANYYPQDFFDSERDLLRFQLMQYQLDIPNHPKMKNLRRISELCHALVESGKSRVYYLIDRLIRLILTLPVSTATTERAFSAMNLVKTRLRNKMEDDFLSSCMIVYIENEIAKNITVEEVIDDFYAMKKRRAQLR